MSLLNTYRHINKTLYTARITQTVLLKSLSVTDAQSWQHANPSTKQINNLLVTNESCILRYSVGVLLHPADFYGATFYQWHHLDGSPCRQLRACRRVGQRILPDRGWNLESFTLAALLHYHLGNLLCGSGLAKDSVVRQHSVLFPSALVVDTIILILLYSY